jgi:ubiquinone/menaquinone biosynthesis C-methylase UbiE
MDETTVSYYDSLADAINEKYPQGYQVALIKSEKYGSLGLREQNYQYLADLGELNHDSFIADVGCGNGQFHAFLKNHPNYKNCRYLGVDCCEKQVDNASKSAESYASSFFCKDMNELLMAEPYFDVVYFIESIGYTTNLDILIKTISTGVKIGGKVIIKNPAKVVNDEELDSKYQEKFANIQSEYGYSEQSLGMLPDRNFIEETFLANGFEVEKIEVPNIDVMTYNQTFCSTEEFCEAHPSYVQHISKNETQNYAPNRYHECVIFVFKKVAEAISHVSELPYVYKTYNEGIEKSQIDPNHPNAPYMQRYSEYREQYISEHPEQADFVQTPCDDKITYDGVGVTSTTDSSTTLSYSTSFSSDSVAEDTSESRVVNLDVSYEIDDSPE